MTCRPAVGRFLSDARCVMIGILIVAVGLISGCGREAEDQTAQSAEAAEVSAIPVAVTTVVRADIDRTLEVSGSLEADDEVDVVAEVSGKVARVHADVGDYVRRGQTLVRVDRQVASAQREQAAAGVRSAEAGLDQAREALDLTDQTTASSVRQAEVGVATAKERLEQARASARLVESQVNSAIEQAQTGVESAETRLAEVRAGARNQERRQAEARVRQARASLNLAEQTYNRHKRLLDGGVISQQQFDQVKTEYEVAQQNYQQAVEQRSLVEEGARTEQVRLAELAVDQAKQQLAQAKANRTQIEVAQQEVRAAEEAVRQSREQLNAAIAARGQVDVQKRQVAAAEAAINQAQAGERMASVRLQKHFVSAPISGTVSARQVDSGEGVSPGVPLLTIVSNEMLYLEGRVGEQDLTQLYVGQSAEVKVDAVPQEVFDAEIIAIAPSVSPESRTGTARVRLLHPAGVVRAGMFARATIVTERAGDVVVIDRDALVTDDDKTVVFAVEDNLARRREIETGLQTETRVEVISGLSPGDKVVIQGQHQLEDGASVRMVESPVARGDTQ